MPNSIEYLTSFSTLWKNLKLIHKTVRWIKIETNTYINVCWFDNGKNEEW